MVAHLLNWWLVSDDAWFYDIMWSVFDVMGAGAFLFISGVSTVLSLKNQQLKETNLGDFNKNISRNKFLIRGLILLVVALLYNIPIALYTGNISDIWIWYVLLTISISILLSWPLIKTSRLFRITLVISIIILNQVLLTLLIPFQHENNFLGILFHFLYNGYPAMDPIMIFFPFFLIGTVIGDILFEIYIQENENQRKLVIKNRLLIPSLIIGPILIIIGILYDFPSFLNTRTFSWTCYSIGIQILLLSVLIFSEETLFKSFKKNFKFLFYFSYYSLTIFLAHNVLYFIFLRSLSYLSIFFFIIATVFLLGLLLRTLYIKFGKMASIKTLINYISADLAKKISEQSISFSKIMLKIYKPKNIQYN